MGVVQLGVVQLGVVQLGVVQTGVDLATSLAPSFFDMGSDAFSTHNFINGTTGRKYVPDLNDPSVNSGL